MVLEGSLNLGAALPSLCFSACDGLGSLMSTEARSSHQQQWCVPPSMVITQHYNKHKQKGRLPFSPKANSIRAWFLRSHDECVLRRVCSPTAVVTLFQLQQQSLILLSISIPLPEQEDREQSIVMIWFRSVPVYRRFLISHPLC